MALRKQEWKRTTRGVRYDPKYYTEVNGYPLTHEGTIMPKNGIDELVDIFDPELVSRNMYEQELLLDRIFNDVDENTVLDGPTEKFGLTLSNIKTVNYLSGQRGEDFRVNLWNIITRIPNQTAFKNSVLMLRQMILTEIADLIENKLAGNNNYYYQCAGFGSFTLTSKEKKCKIHEASFTKFAEYSSRHGKIGFTDYEVKFAYRTSRIYKDQDDTPTFIDSEGMVMVIDEIPGVNKGVVDEGIYVIKQTPELGANTPYSVMPLPLEGDYVKSETLNGIFFHSYKDFKDFFQREYKVSYDSCTQDERVFKVKKLIGRILYGGITDTSHGFANVVSCFSLTRKNLWMTSPEWGVSEVLNVIPDGTDNNISFQNALAEVGLSMDLLKGHDYLIRRTFIGSGTGRVSPQSTRLEKVKINRKSGLSDIASAAMDEDLALYTETGIGVFSSKDAAERCMKHGGGDITKYAKYINDKIGNKSEKKEFSSALKNAALVGAGAAIPKIVEYAIASRPVTDTTAAVFDTVSGAIMKPMLPPMGTLASSALVKIQTTANSIATAVSTFASTIAPYIIPVAIIAGVVAGGKFIYEKVSGKDGIMSNIFDKVISVFQNAGSNVVDAASNGGSSVANFFGGVFEFVKKTGVAVFNFVKDNFFFAVETVKRVFSNIEGETLFDKAGSLFTNVLNGMADVGGKIWDYAKTAGSWVIEKVSGFFGWAGGILGMY